MPKVCHSREYIHFWDSTIRLGSLQEYVTIFWCRVGLDIRSEDLHVLVQILGKGVAGPSTDALHGLKRDTSE